ncbi:hypothetical protein NLI96_g2134 [Meripilus lineatus]|uniref:Prenylcysteine lyase domain-containing protein n=1 Tax=Meripilus lineatus TaxID=2056292 RepID=A0AAD5YGU8_9APHY|nr:hypothetical protein NLI96_g2134 [Physisporinus lineatus]
MRYTILILTVGVANALQFPSWVPFVNSYKQPQATYSIPAEAADAAGNRIAVVGAGAGGSSAAFWIGKARERFGLDVEIDVFEREDYVGGRSITVQPYNDSELEPMELGGSVFVKANKNLWRASDEFGFERFDFEEGSSTMAIWDGTEFLLKMGGKGRFYDDWFDSLKVLWRYGYNAPSKTKSLVNNMITQYLTLYSSSTKPFSNISDITDSFEWGHIAAQTTSEYLDLHAVDRRWTRELVEAATRVNYGQNVDAIHAIEGLVSMAATGASGVKRGNYQLFEEFIRRSRANLFLNTTVLSITRDSQTSLYTIRTLNQSTVVEDTRLYRGVIFAAPFHSSNIKLSLSPEAPTIPPQPYVPLHVTLLSTTAAHIRPEYFGFSAKTDVPGTILTSYEGFRNGGSEPEFNSVSVHGKVRRKDGVAVEKEEFLVKIFSKERVEDEQLTNLFGEVGWVYRKLWEAYPVLKPTSEFPPVKLDRGFYYVNAFEPLISTLETETISSRNAVDLLLSELFDAGICPKSVDVNGTEIFSSSDAQKGDEFVYGWDC